MEIYKTPVKFLNPSSSNPWQCSFEPKEEIRLKLPKIQNTDAENKKKNSEIKFLTLKNNDPTRYLMVHEKGTFKTKTWRSRIPDVREMLSEIDDKVVEELGPWEKTDPPYRSIQAFGNNMTRMEYLDWKKQEFYSNLAIKEMISYSSGFGTQLARIEKKLEARAQELYQDACAFNDFVKENDTLFKEAKTYQKDETTQLEVVRESFLHSQSSSIGIKKELISMDEKLSEYLSMKSFLLLVLLNNNRNPRSIVLPKNWKVFRKSRAYSRLLPDELIEMNSVYNVTSVMSSIATKVSLTSILGKKKSKSAAVFLDRAYIGGQSSKKLEIAGGRREVSSTKQGKWSVVKKVKSKIANKPLEFLKDDYFTKVKFPEEWIKDQTYSNTEADKIIPKLDDPHWLLNIINNLKEENLKFITRFQSFAKEMELRKMQFERAKQKYSLELGNLNAHVTQIQKQIDFYEDQISEFKSLSKATTGTPDEEKVKDLTTKDPTRKGPTAKGPTTKGPTTKLTVDEQLAATGKAIRKIYREITGDAVIVDQLVMFSKIEFTCYKYFDTMDVLGDQIEALLKKQGKIRRRRKTKEKELQDKKDAEKRVEAARLKSLDEKVVFFGRKLMPRSQPYVKKTLQKQINAEEDLSYFFTE